MLHATVAVTRLVISPSLGHDYTTWSPLARRLV